MREGEEACPSTDAELLASREELQSLKKELAALNGQLQEILERQQTSANDLENVLYSTDVATLVLDHQLNIRLFTPATKALFNILPGDIGRPLTDLRFLAADSALLADARSVLLSRKPLDRDIEVRDDVWFTRRILPYRTRDNRVEGVVITFADITERKRTAQALETVTRQSELSNISKSRFLAAASHDLRQPLQTLALLQGLLMSTVENDKSRQFLTQIDETLAAMSGMLNALLDINQIGVGTIRPEVTNFPINDLLNSLKGEFTYHAQAAGLSLHMVPCSLSIRSDPRLLEQMLRNLLANAMKYTKQGRVLLGCRRRAGELDIEIWDTGIGIPEKELQAIFEDYHQLDSASPNRRFGPGLGLPIARRLGTLLGHRIHVDSRPGKGSVFRVEIKLQIDEAGQWQRRPRESGKATEAGNRSTGVILVIEDDPDVRGLVELLLENEGHRVVSAPDGIAALELVAQRCVRPDIVIADHNPPNGMNGIECAARLREKFGAGLPVVVLTGDISAETLHSLAHEDCLRLGKPVGALELCRTVRSLLPAATAVRRSVGTEPPVIYVVDDDTRIREALCRVIKEDGWIVEAYPACEAFLENYRPGRAGCLVIDAIMPGMDGLELLRRLRDSGDLLPAIMITGQGNVQIAIQAMKAGATDFIEKPFRNCDLIASIDQALERSKDMIELKTRQEHTTKLIARLTQRERQVMELILAGHTNKIIAADLGISQRTVEKHRAAIMRKTETGSLPALARLALVMAPDDVDNQPDDGLAHR